MATQSDGAQPEATLKPGAIGFVSSMVIGLASTSPAYAPLMTPSSTSGPALLPMASGRWSPLSGFTRRAHYLRHLSPCC